MDIIPHLKRGLSMDILWQFHGQSRSGVTAECGFSLAGHATFVWFGVNGLIQEILLKINNKL
jgi:hypothetical protein